MPPKKKPHKPTVEPRHIKEFEGVRSKPVRGRGPGVQPRAEATQTPRRDQGAEPATTRAEHSGGATPEKRVDDQPGESVATGPLVDPRSDPEVMFRILSEKIAVKVDRAAMRAGASVAQEVSRRLTAELDAAIAGAQSTAGTMGNLVQQAVQAAVDEALRTAVLNATRVHEEHLAQLALIDRTAQTAHDITAVKLRVEEEMRRSGLTRITTADPEAFNLVNPQEHPDSSAYEVLAPAYADRRTGRIIQRGEMRRMPSAPAAPVAEGRSDR
ncbi:hypothetical protein ACGF3K_09005 [Streptomyces sp. NPDC047980]|uniref:hypothetical protein n=1 Tax=Streptomyces sp. NPDC047980 TaxID=3365494 RepID=UPI00370FBDFC